MKRTPLLALCGLVATLTAACGGDSPASPSSTSGASTSGTASTGTNLGSSHNAGAACLNCHGFGAAGTVYKSSGAVNPGVVIRLLSGNADTGAVVATATSDNSGNFRVNGSVSYAGGIYLTATSPSGTVKKMTAAATSGNCNASGCHNSARRIVID